MTTSPYLSLTTPIYILQTAIIHRRICSYHLPRILFLISVHYSSALKPIQRTHHGETAPIGLEAVCRSRITSRLSAFPLSFIYNNTPKLHVHEHVHGGGAIGQPLTTRPDHSSPGHATQSLSPNPLVLLFFFWLFFFFFPDIKRRSRLCFSVLFRSPLVFR